MRKAGKPLWFAFLDRYTRLAFYKKPASGSIAVFAFLIVVPVAVYIVGGYPLLHKDRFKGLQRKVAEEKDP